MASKTTKRYIEYCKLHRLDINSKDSLERYRIDKLLNDDKISKEKSYQISGKIEKEFKNIAKLYFHLYVIVVTYEEDERWK